MPDFIDICEKAARAGADVLMDWRGRFQAREKGPKDLVTEADLESQRVIRQILLGEFPDHGFVGEEEQVAARRYVEGAGHCWVVDPLDGTANYVHRLQTFAVSVALLDGARHLVGTVFDPVMNECFSAIAGEGAYLNGTRIAVSSCRQLKDAMVAVSFSANVPRGSPEIGRFIEVLHASQGLRRLGSAALNLSYLAAGRLDGYWASQVMPWDVAAGVLLVREAGGLVTGMDGSGFDLNHPHLAASCVAQVHAELVQVLTSVESSGFKPDGGSILPTSRVN